MQQSNVSLVCVVDDETNDTAEEWSDRSCIESWMTESWMTSIKTDKKGRSTKSSVC